MKNPATTSEEDENQGIKERRHNPENCLDRIYQYRSEPVEPRMGTLRVPVSERLRVFSGDKSNSTTKCKTQESGGKKA
jgi:hypothetical protein